MDLKITPVRRNYWAESSLANEDAKFYESLHREIFDFFIVRSGLASGIR